LDFGLTAADYKETFYTSKRSVFYAHLYAPHARARLLHAAEANWNFARSRLVNLARRTPGVRRWIRKANYTVR